MRRARSKKERRYPHPPRITLRVLLAFVVVMALFNVQLPFMRQNRAYASIPIDVILHRELASFLILNGFGLLVSLWLFYAPWLSDKSPGEYYRTFIPSILFISMVMSLGCIFVADVGGAKLPSQVNIVWFVISLATFVAFHLWILLRSRHVSIKLPVPTSAPEGETPQTLEADA